MTRNTADRRQRAWRRFRQLLVGMVVLILFSLGISWYVAGQLVAAHPHTVGMPPSDFPAESVEITCNWGIVLSGWYLPHNTPKGAVLLLHGIRSSRLSMVKRAQMLAKEGYSVLLIDLRAHGESSGEHSTVGYEEQHDVAAALDFLHRNQPDQPLAIIGVSMGGAAAVLTRPDVDALVLESVYPTITEAVGNRVRERIGILEPIATWALLVQLRVRLGISPEALRPIDALPKLGCPVLMMTGDEDTYTTLAETRRMFACAAEPKRLEIFPGVGHTSLFNSDPEKYRKRVLAFFDQHLGQHDR